MICKECGAQIDDNAEKCPFCGAVYKESAETNEPEETAETVTDETVRVDRENDEQYEEPVSEPEPEAAEDDESDKILDENEIKRRRQIERMRAEKQSQLEEIERRREEKRRRQRRGRIIAIAVAAVCVAAAAAAGIYMLRGHDDGNVVLTTEAPSPTPEVTLPVISPTPAASVSPAPTATAASWQATNGGSSSGGSSSGSGSTSSGSSSSGRGSSSSSNGSSTGRGSSSSGGSSSSSSTASGSGSGSSSGGTLSNTPTTSAAVVGGKTYSAEGGMTDGRFTAALVTGGEVIHDANGRTYMTFTYNGTTYYANADASSYTEYIAGRPITLSAYPTSEVYNGNRVYEITAITHYTGEYIFPNSGFELLTESDLAGKSKSVLALGRNEIYARHGREFKMQEFRDYFSKCSWYSVDPNYNYEDDSSNLNSIERANANFIKSYEDKMD